MSALKYVKVLESKVVAAAAGASTGGALGVFVTYLIGVYVFGASATANGGQVAVSAVPGPVLGIIAIIFAGTGAGIAGYEAPHTERAPVPADDASDAADPVQDVPALPAAPAVGGPLADDDTDSLTGSPADTAPAS